MDDNEVDNSDDNEVIKEDTDDDNLILFTKAERSLRLSIARYYETALGAPDRTEWL